MTRRYHSVPSVPRALWTGLFDRSRTLDYRPIDLDFVLPTKHRSPKPIIGSAFGDSVAHDTWKSIPAWYLITFNDHAIQPDLQRFYATRMNAKTTAINSRPAGDAETRRSRRNSSLPGRPAPFRFGRHHSGETLAEY